MRRTSFLLALVAAVVLLAAAPATGGATRSEPAMLRESVIVNDTVIRLGDLFINAGPHAETAIAQAPAPGGRAVFDAVWLYRVAQAYRIPWRPLARQDKVVVERASQVISREEIAGAIHAALVERGVDPDVEVEIMDHMLRVHIAPDAEPTIAVEDLNYNPRARFLTAVIAAPAGSPMAQRFRINGKVHRQIDVPVLARRLPADEIIGKGDIKYIRMRADRLSPDTVVDPSGIIGMSPKRVLQPDQPLRTSEVARPNLVTRREMVTIVFAIPMMTLTARGKALDDGAEGDTVRVLNLRSNKTMEATVTAAGTVSVSPAAQLASN